MQFEWYRVAVFANQQSADLALNILKQHNKTQHISAQVRLDTDAYGLYISSQEDINNVHRVLSNNEALIDAIGESLEQLKTQHVTDRTDYKESEQSDTQKKLSDHAAFTYYQSYFLKNPTTVPLTLLFMALSIVGFIIPLVMWDSRLFFELNFLSLSAMLNNHKYWQLITPTFLHFSWMHIIFNTLWMGILGARLEYSMGRVQTAYVFLGISVFANCVQYFLSAGQIFGGLSGLVYGLIGFLIIQRRCVPTSINAIGSGLIISMLVFMLLGLFGIMGIFIAGSIANGAHVGGFLAGILIACMMYFKDLAKVINT